jgi:hypothetical protein
MAHGRLVIDDEHEWFGGGAQGFPAIGSIS